MTGLVRQHSALVTKITAKTKSVWCGHKISNITRHHHHHHYQYHHHITNSSRRNGKNIPSDVLRSVKRDCVASTELSSRHGSTTVLCRAPICSIHVNDADLHKHLLASCCFAVHEYFRNWPKQQNTNYRYTYPLVNKIHSISTSAEHRSALVSSALLHAYFSPYSSVGPD